MRISADWGSGLLGGSGYKLRLLRLGPGGGGGEPLGLSGGGRLGGGDGLEVGEPGGGRAGGSGHGASLPQDGGGSWGSGGGGGGPHSLDWGGILLHSLCLLPEFPVVVRPIVTSVVVFVRPIIIAGEE